MNEIASIYYSMLSAISVDYIHLWIYGQLSVGSVQNYKSLPIYITWDTDSLIYLSTTVEVKVQES